MAGSKDKSMQISDELKRAYRSSAEREFYGKTPEELLKTRQGIYNEERPTFWKWIKARAGSFVNMVKIAALSIFLGRNATSNRLNTTDRKEEYEAFKEMMKKEIRINVLEEKINQITMDRDDKETPDKNPSPDKEMQEEKITDKKPQEQQERTDNEKATELQKTQTVFAEQMNELSDKYKEGLQEFLQQQTGINKDFIKIENFYDNLKNDYGIRVTFDVDSTKESPYKGINGSFDLMQEGNIANHTKVAEAIRTSILYYTSEVYREAKDNTRFPGTIPSRMDIKRLNDDFITLAQNDLGSGQNSSHYGKELFGHNIEFVKDCDSVVILIDNKEVDFTEGKSIDESLYVAIRDVITNREHGDYAKIQEFANLLHEQTHSDVHEMHYAKYTFKDLEQVLEKGIADTLTTGDISSKTVQFQGHEIEITLSDNQNGIERVIIDSNVVYNAADGILEANDIAQQAALELAQIMETQNMYDYSTDEQEVNDVFKVSELDENGHLQTVAYEPEQEYEPFCIEELSELENDHDL